MYPVAIEYVQPCLQHTIEPLHASVRARPLHNAVISLLRYGKYMTVRSHLLSITQEYPELLI